MELNDAKRLCQEDDRNVVKLHGNMAPGERTTNRNDRNVVKLLRAANRSAMRHEHANTTEMSLNFSQEVRQDCTNMIETSVK